MRHALLLSPALLLTVSLAACGSVATSGASSSSGPTSKTDGGTGTDSSVLSFASVFPMGDLECSSDIYVPAQKTNFSAAATVILRESGGVVTAVFPDDEGGDAPVGTVTFDVTSPTTALAASGQAFGLEGDTSISTGALSLVDGLVAMTFVGSDGGTLGWVSCTVPYAACPAPVADPAASLPSGTYVGCTDGNSDSDDITLSRSGGTVTVTLGAKLATSEQATSPITLDVVGPGVATRKGGDGGSTAPCGNDGANASLQLAASGALFLDIGTGWQVDPIVCPAKGNPPFVAGTPPTVTSSGTDAGTLQQGRSVDACSQCNGNEVCVGVTFQGDLCTLPMGGTGSGSGAKGGGALCPPDTTYNGDCCVPNPETTYTCWLRPPSCGDTATCECASGVVLLACGEGPFGGSCTEDAGVLNCMEDSP